MVRVSNGNKGLLFTALRFLPIIAFILFAVCSFAFYAMPTMTLMGEKGETVYELAKLEEKFAENLLIFAYITIGIACIVALLFILPQTANRKYYVVWLHEIVALISTVLYVCVLIQICKGIDFVKEWGMEKGTGLILPLVFVIVFLVFNVCCVLGWRIFGGENVLKEDAQAYVSATVLPLKPDKVEKPLSRMPNGIQKATKLYVKKCYYTIAMWGLICTLLMIVAGLYYSKNPGSGYDFDRGRHPLYLLHVLPANKSQVRYGVSHWFVWAFLYLLMVTLSIIFITAIVFKIRKQKKVWNFKQSNVWYALGQLSLIAVAAFSLYFSYTICDSMIKDRFLAHHAQMLLDSLDIKISVISGAVVVLLFVIFRMILQMRIAKVKKADDFGDDVVFYENYFTDYYAEYKNYRAELRAYNRKTYRYRRAETALM